MANVILKCPLCRHHIHMDRVGPHLKQFCVSLNAIICDANPREGTMKTTVDVAANREHNIRIFSATFPIIKEYERGNATLEEVQAKLDMAAQVPRSQPAAPAAKENRK